MLFNTLYEGAAEVNIDTPDQVIINVDPDDTVTDDVEGFNAEEIEYAENPTLEPDGDIGSDPVEEAMMANYEFDYNWQQIMEAVGLYEINEMAAGRTPIFEEGQVKNFFKNMKETISSFIRKVGQWIADFIDNLKAHFRGDDRWFAKNMGAIKAGYNKQVKSFKVENEYQWNDKYCESAPKKFSDACKGFADGIGTHFGKKKGEGYENTTDFKETIKARTNQPNSLNVDEDNDETWKKYRTAEKPEKGYPLGDISFDSIKNALVNTDGMIKTIRQSYKYLENVVNKVLKMLSVEEKRIANDKENSDGLTVVSKNVSAIRDILKKLNGKMCIMCKALRGRATCYRKIAKKLISEGGADDYKATFESNSSYRGSGFLENVHII